MTHAEPWLSGCQVICRAVGHYQALSGASVSVVSDQLSGTVSAVGCCRVRV